MRVRVSKENKNKRKKKKHKHDFVSAEGFALLAAFLSSSSCMAAPANSIISEVMAPYSVEARCNDVRRSMRRSLLDFGDLPGAHVDAATHAHKHVNKCNSNN